MNWFDFNQAIEHGRAEVKRGDDAAKKLAHLMRHRLRAANIDTETLRALKRELQDFNSTTGRWRR